MDWLHATFRYLYVDEPGDFAGLPAVTRGIAALILRFADADEGFIAIAPGESPSDACCRRIGAHKSERKIVSDAISALVQDGYLVLSDTRVSVRNWQVGQRLAPASREERAKERTAAAMKKAAQRAAKKATHAGTNGGHVPGTTVDNKGTCPRDNGVDNRGHVPGTNGGHVPGDISRAGASAGVDAGAREPAQARPREGAGASAGTTVPFSSRSVVSEEEKKPAHEVQPDEPKASDEKPKTVREEVADLLAESPEIAEAIESGTVKLDRMVGRLLGDAGSGGWKDRRVVECLPFALRALSMASDPQQGPQAYVCNVVARVARPGVLEREMGKFTRAPKPSRDADDYVPPRPEWDS